MDEYCIPDRHTPPGTIGLSGLERNLESLRELLPEADRCSVGLMALMLETNALEHVRVLAQQPPALPGRIVYSQCQRSVGSTLCSGSPVGRTIFRHDELSRRCRGPNCSDQAASRMNFRLLKGLGHLPAPGWRLSSRMRRFRYCFQSLVEQTKPRSAGGWFRLRSDAGGR